MRERKILQDEIERYKERVFIVEGEKDVASLKFLGFKKVHALHKNSVSISERIEEILLSIGRKEKACILTDFDKPGKRFYAQIRRIMQERGILLDSGLRKVLMRAGISHVEGFDKLVEIDD